jgi:hypothetical protein
MEKQNPILTLTATKYYFQLIKVKRKESLRLWVKGKRAGREREVVSLHRKEHKGMFRRPTLRGQSRIYGASGP